MARPVIVLLACLALVASTVPAAAQDDRADSTLSRVVSSGKLRVGMSGSQPPLNFTSRDGEMMGLEVDLARGLARLMQVELEIVRRPFGQLLGALRDGDVDLVISGTTITPARSLEATFVGPYFLSGKSILTRSSRLAQASQARELDQPDVKLAALEGSTSEQFVRKALPKASLVTTSDYDEAVKKLLADEVDAVVADREMVTLTAFLHPKEGLATLREPFTLEPIGIAAPADDRAFATYLGNALGTLEASGALSNLRSRWLERSDWVQQLP